MEIELYENQKIEKEKISGLFKFLFTCLGAMLPLISLYRGTKLNSSFFVTIRFSLPIALFLTVIYVLVYSYLIFSHGQNKKRVALLFMSLYLFYVIFMWDEIVNGLNWWLYSFEEGNLQMFYMGDFGVSQNHFIFAALGVYALVIVLLSWKRVFRFQLFLLAVWWIVLGGINFDLLFHWRVVFFVLYIFCLLGMGNKRVTRRNGKSYYSQIKIIRSKAVWQNGIWLVVLCILLIGIYGIVQSPAKYKDSAEFVKKQDQFLDFIETHTLEEAWNLLKKEVIPSDIASGGMAGGKLGRVKGIEYSDSPQLEIIIPLAARADGMYIKGFVGGEYTGNEWIGEEDKEEFTVDKRTYDILSGMEEITTRAISIRVLDAENIYSYRPYFARLSSSLRRMQNGEEYFYQDKSTEEYVDAVYSFCKYNQAGIFAIEDFHYGTSSNEFATAIVKEKRYREEALEKYLDVSKVGKLDEELSGQNIEDENGEMLIADGRIVESYYYSHGLTPYIKYVQNFLQTHAEYNLTPGKLEEGEDFVENFLYKKRKGYCTAFASAGTMIFRRLGIPARYVEGYILGKNDIADGADHDYINEDYVKDGEACYGVRFTLTDRNAHAWVEIYEDGVGWIPVEVTPGYEGEVNTLGERKKSEENQSSERNTSTTKKTEEKSTKEKKNREEYTSASNQQESQTVSQNKTKGTAKGRKTLLVILFSVVILYILISSIIIYKKKHKIFYRKKKKEKKPRKSRKDKESYVVWCTPKDQYQKAFFGWEKAWHRVLRFQGYREEGLQSLGGLAGCVVQIYTYLDKDYVFENLKLMEKCHYSKEGVEQEEYKQIYEFLYGMVFASYAHAKFWEKPFLKILVSRYFHFGKIGV